MIIQTSDMFYMKILERKKKHILEHLHYGLQKLKDDSKHSTSLPLSAVSMWRIPKTQRVAIKISTAQARWSTKEERDGKGRKYFESLYILVECHQHVYHTFEK